MRRGDSKKAKPGAASPAFKRWFRGSKVVNGDGSPRVVYHGTRSPVDFDVFRFGTQTGPRGRVLIEGAGDASAFLGPHFAQSREIASAFACGKAADWDRGRKVQRGGCGGRVMPVYLAIRSPKVFEDDDDLLYGPQGIYVVGGSEDLWDDLATTYDVDDERGLSSEGEPESLKYALDNYFDGVHAADGPRALERIRREAAESAREAWTYEGHDGVRYGNRVEAREIGLPGPDTTWVPFDPSQIKSAVSNDGGYRPSSPSVISNPSARDAAVGEPPSARRLALVMRRMEALS